MMHITDSNLPKKNNKKKPTLENGFDVKVVLVFVEVIVLGATLLLISPPLTRTQALSKWTVFPNVI